MIIQRLFEMKGGMSIPKFDLIGKDLHLLLDYIREFDKATGELIENPDNEDASYNYHFIFSELESFSEVYQNFLCSSLPDKEGKILQYFYSLDYKDAVKRYCERVKINKRY